MADTDSVDLTGLDQFRPPQMGDLDANVTSAEASRSEAQQNLNTTIETPPQPPAQEQFSEAAPQRNLGSLMSMAPWMIALSIFGGSRTKLSANNMLAATNGMIQGLTSGDEKRYQDEYAKWKAEHDQFAEVQKQKWDIYREMVKVYKDRIDGKERALQVAEQAVRDTRKDRADAMSSYLQTVKASLALRDESRKWAALDEQVRAHKASEQERVDAEVGKNKRAGDRTGAKQASHDELVAKANKLIDKMVYLVKSDKSLVGMTGLSGKARRVGETLGNVTGTSQSTSARDFESGISELQLMLAPLLAGSGRTGKDQREKLETVVRGLRMGDTSQDTLSALKDLKEQINALPAKEGEHGPVIRTGTQKGRKVVQYEDGTVDYAD